ncbi:cell wall hydrolase [Sandarakinorhabdus oryzae]|uniref:cell wall hydrolase n=1 Tax=Sandarakinorhabdus oryzae TaxID=2675220 RepID=UPI001F3A97B8|nr:cell wall hydrolase [Sandarakinorhabdus oryzae]
MNVTLTPRHQMQAAAAAVLLASGMALSHVAAQTPDSQAASQPVAVAPAEVEPVAEAKPSLNERHVTCMAKVVHHEAGNQPLAGQIAVAQVLINRVKQGFGDNVCDVANQPGQFFRLNRYHPNRKSAQWAEAVEVARTVLAGEARDWSKGALYFHANWARPNGFFRGRTKVARLEDHDFYR